MVPHTLADVPSERNFHLAVHDIVIMSQETQSLLDSRGLQPWLYDVIQAERPVYSHLPLDAGRRQIRLLHLKPSLSGQLRGNIQVVSLDDSPDYEALSYTWGATTRNEKITIGQDISIPITDNLARALRQLRRYSKDRALWIDAIYIVQSDLDERSQQAAMMGEIYQHARRVCIWLGDAPYWTSLWKRECIWLVSTLLRLPDAIGRDWDKIGQRTLHWPSWLQKLLEDIPRNFIVRIHLAAIEYAIHTTEPRWHDRAG